jgi:hypothetical protein
MSPFQQQQHSIKIFFFHHGVSIILTAGAEKNILFVEGFLIH